MAWTRDQLNGYVEYHDAAIKLLQQICGTAKPTGAQLTYKTVSEFRFCCCDDGAVWKGISDTEGFVIIGTPCEPGAVAHEIGHGFHECLRAQGRFKDTQGKDIDILGEDYAQAIRYFTSDRLGKTADCDAIKKGHDKLEILKACGNKLDKFIERLNAGVFDNSKMPAQSLSGSTANIPSQPAPAPAPPPGPHAPPASSLASTPKGGSPSTIR